CSPESGSTFPLGETTVTCTAEDKAGNKSTATFKVTVTEKAAEDKTPPVIKVPADMTVSAPGPSGAILTYEATAPDPADPVASLNCTPASGSTFPLGETTVACTAEDTHKNVSHASFKVTVKPPEGEGGESPAEQIEALLHDVQGSAIQDRLRSRLSRLLDDA